MKKRILALLLTLSMVLSLIPKTAFAADGNNAEVPQSQTQTAEAVRAGENLSVLAFSSDVHNMENNTSANRLGSWLDKMKSIYGVVHYMAFGGDMGEASYGGSSSFWTKTQADMDAVASKGVTGVYTTGNHEYSMGGDFSYSTYTSGGYSSTETKGQYKINSVGAEGDNFIIYCLGSVSSSSSYSNQVESLTSFLNGAGNDKVIFIITHFPLHYYSQRSTTGASDVVDLLNNAVANNGQKIVFLWGHNHTMSDTYYDYIYKPGESIPTSSSSSSSKTIQFYYGAAGCMSDSEYGTGSAYVKGKGLLVTVNSKNQLSFTYYDENANNVSEGGTYTEQDPVPATEISIDDIVVTGDDGQPVVVETPTLEAGKTLQLSVSFYPEEATTRTVSWSSSNTSIATVDSNGKVKGVSAGNVTITASVENGLRAVVSSSIDIEILPRSGNEPMYVLTNKLEPGKDYIIVNKNSGEGYALTNNSGSVGKTTVEIDGDVIYTENENIVFTAEGSGTTVTAMSNGGRYISAGNGSLSLATSAPSNRTFAYGTDNKLTVKSGNSTYYVYYSTYNNGNYSSSTSSSSSSSPREVYLFAKVEEQIAVTGVTVSPTEETIEARKSVQLTATVAPSNATNKKVTWSSSDTSVATVDSSGKVRGVAPGTATITVTTADGGKTATAAITVTENTSANTNYVIVIDNYALSTATSPNTAYGQNNNTGYQYTGLAGVVYSSSSTADESIRWIIEETDGGYYIMSLDGRYLNATYTSVNNPSSSNPTRGVLKLDDTPDVWSLDSGYSLEDGTVDGSKLKSANASATASSAKYLGYENNENLFTVRSSDNADTITIEEASDPVAVTGVTVAPIEATIEARKTVQLTATVSPENATNKNVTWSSSNTSIATVDANGKVRGVAEGTATITVTTADGSKTATATITVTQSTSTEPTYVITVGNFALSTDTTTDQLSNNNGAYIYTGLAGAAFDSATVPADNIRWYLEETEGGYYIKSMDGRYLNATYTSVSNPSSSNPTRGVLKLDDTPDVWVLDGSLDSWEVDGSMLKSTNASATASSAKYLAYEEGSTSSPLNLFTIRSEGNADETHGAVAADPVAVTGVTVTPAEATVEERKTIQLTATVLPEDATNKNVTWSSSDTTVATVDTNGKVKGVKEGTAVITVTTEDGSKTATATIHVTPNTSTEIRYVITIDGYALSTEAETDYHPESNGTNKYYGFKGVAYNGEDPDDSITWYLEETDGGYYIKSTDGRFLNATYQSGNPIIGHLYLNDTPDVWVLDGTLEDWIVSGSMLKSTNADKYLAFETVGAAGNVTMFTIRSQNNADSTEISSPDIEFEVRYEETDSLKDGKEYIIAVTKDDGSVYAVKNVSGSSTANTGSVTLTVVPASGSDPAYIVTDDEGVVWKYTSSNQYLNTSNSHYLGYESSTYLPRVSSQGRAITYSGGKLQIASRYLTCDNGTFGTSTSSSSGASVRIFVKTVEIVTCTHEWGEPVWNWTGDVQTRAAASATATFTCTKCGETEVVTASVTGPKDDGFFYATAIGPDGQEYEDRKEAKLPVQAGTIVITADKTEVRVGDTVTFTITMGPVENLSSMQMKLDLPEGLTFKSGDFSDVFKEAIVAIEGISSFDEARFTFASADKMFISGFIGISENSQYTNTEETVIGTFTCEVTSAFSGTQTVNMTEDDLEFYTLDDEEIPMESTGVDLTLINTYTVTFKPNGGTPEEDKTQIVDGGEATALSQNTFTREGYDFTGWNTDPDGNGTAYTDAQPVTLTADLTLYAQWVIKKFTITWVNDDGTVLETDENVEYGTTPTYDGDIPTKDATQQYTYTFKEWSPAIVAAAADATYTATYTETVNKYTVKFVDEDGETGLLEAAEYDYGTAAADIVKPADPTKEATAQYTFTFAGWDPELADVTADVTYKATYTSTVNEYTITFVNYDGTVLQTGKVKYGETPAYNGETPTRPATAEFTYTFTGWNPTIVTVTGDATYTAEYTSAINTYAVSGTVESFTIDALDGVTYGSGAVTLKLVPAVESENPITATAAEDGSYSFPAVPAGTYELQVSKADHATRNYTLVVADKDVVQDVKIQLLGDINGDGKVTALDLALINWYVTRVKEPDDPYKKACADVNMDGEISTVEIGYINSHVKKASIIWSVIKNAQP